MQINGKLTILFHIDEIANPGNRVKGGACCQGVADRCTELCKPVLSLCVSRYYTFHHFFSDLDTNDIFHKLCCSSL